MPGHMGCDTVTVKIEGADEETAAPAMEKFFNEHL